LTKGRLVPHLFLTAGYRFLLGEDLNATPSFMIKYIQGSSFREFQPEANLKLQFRDQLWAGGSYRYEDGYSGYMGLSVSNTFNISYAYEKSLNNNILRDFNRGTHEMVFGFMLGNKYSEKCPRCY
jgi:type IX secretion system PorP/SprF family membrane protein